MYSTRTSWIVIGGFILFSILVSMAHADWYGVAQLGQGRTHKTADPVGGSAWEQPKCCDAVEQRISPAYGLGLGYEKSWYAFEGQYRDLGNYSAFGSWRFSDDGEDTGTTTYGYGRTHINGLTFSGIGRYHFNKDWSTGLEVGAFRWNAKWTESYVNAGSVKFSTWPSQKWTGVSPLIGVLVTYREWDVRAEILHVEPRDSNLNAVRMLSLGVKF